MAFKITKKLLWSFVICLFFDLHLTGCTQVAFKQGGGLEDYGKAQSQCEPQAADEQAYAACLKAKGWTLKNPTVVAAPLRSLSVETPIAETSGVGTSKVATPKAETATTTSTPSSKITVLPDGTPTSSPTAVVSAKVSPPASLPSQYKVVSWWKLGGSSDSLNLALAGCWAKVGEHPFPAGTDPIYSRNMVLCMGDSGWKALTQK